MVLIKPLDIKEIEYNYCDNNYGKIIIIPKIEKFLWKKKIKNNYKVIIDNEERDFNDIKSLMTYFRISTYNYRYNFSNSTSFKYTIDLTNNKIIKNGYVHIILNDNQAITAYFRNDKDLDACLKKLKIEELSLITI